MYLDLSTKRRVFVATKKKGEALPVWVIAYASIGAALLLVVLGISLATF